VAVSWAVRSAAFSDATRSGGDSINVPGVVPLLVDVPGLPPPQAVKAAATMAAAPIANVDRIVVSWDVLVWQNDSLR
jgi:hypothetical protein